MYSSDAYEIYGFVAPGGLLSYEALQFLQPQPLTPHRNLFEACLNEETKPRIQIGAAAHLLWGLGVGCWGCKDRKAS